MQQGGVHFELLGILELVKERLEGTDEERDRQAWQLTALCLGGILLARTVNDEDLAGKILADCRVVYGAEREG